MSDDQRGPSWLRTLRSLQTGVQQAGPAASISYTLIGAIGLCGGLGYLIDRWTGSAPMGLVIGLLFGVVAGLYLLARELWGR